MHAVLSTGTNKAFDSLHHALMIKEPEAYGLSLELERSYLIERKNCVKINNMRGALL